MQEHHIHHILSPVTNEKVFHAINSLKPYKAPGPDGIKQIFYQKYWHVVGDIIFNMVVEAFRMGFFPQKLAETFIVLIPKEDNPALV